MSVGSFIAVPVVPTHVLQAFQGKIQYSSREHSESVYSAAAFLLLDKPCVNVCTFKS